MQVALAAVSKAVFEEQHETYKIRPKPITHAMRTAIDSRIARW